VALGTSHHLDIPTIIARPSTPVTAKSVLHCRVTHCLVNASLHSFTQHPLKHKGIAKLLCL